MSIRGPWYVSARAVREYAAIVGLDGFTDEGFAQAEDGLLLAIKRAHHVRNQRNGLQLWRSTVAPRLRFLVSTQPREEGTLPQLVRVLPEHD